MLKKLKKKFLVASIVSLSIVISILIGAINFLNFKSVIRRADEILDYIMDNEGKFPDTKLDLTPPEDFITAETPYESRFFTVSFNEEGELHSVNTSQIAAVNDEMAVEMANSVLKRGKERGLVGYYRYLVSEEDDFTNLIFLDCRKSLENTSIFMALSVTFSALGIVAVFFVLLIVSGRILKPISESYDKQRRFIADAGHDIKTPLTIIDADTELLELDVGENEWLNDIKKQTERLTALTTELIYLSKMEEKRKAEYSFIPLSDVTEEIVQSFAAPAKTKSISFNADITPGIFYNGDEAGIKKVIHILLDNATKYSPEGSEISLSLKRQKGAISLSVRNYAKDLSDDSIEHLFERFYRSDAARSSAGGFGIGLSVAHAVITSHKGKIKAEKDGDYLVIEINI